MGGELVDADGLTVAVLAVGQQAVHAVVGALGIEGVPTFGGGEAGGRAHGARPSAFDFGVPADRMPADGDTFGVAGALSGWGIDRLFSPTMVAICPPANVWGTSGVR